MPESPTLETREGLITSAFAWHKPASSGVNYPDEQTRAAAASAGVAQICTAAHSLRSPDHGNGTWWK